jgi:hypothetical protein
MLRPGAKLGNAVDWGGKLHGQTVRLALVLYLMTTMRSGWGSPIGAEPMRAAVELARYFIEHTLVVLDLMGANETTSLAKVVLDWVKRTKSADDIITKRDVFNGIRTQKVSRADQLDDPLQLLVDRGWLNVVAVPERRPGGGRPPSPKYTVNPALWADGGSAGFCVTGNPPQNPDDDGPEAPKPGSAGSASSAHIERVGDSSLSLESDAQGTPTPPGRLHAQPAEPAQLPAATLPALAEYELVGDAPF